MGWPSFKFNPRTVLVVFLALLGAINHYSQSILSEVLFLAIRRVGVLFRLAFLYLLPAYRFGRLFSLARSAIIQSNIISCSQHRVLLFVLY